MTWFTIFNIIKATQRVFRALKLIRAALRLTDICEVLDRPITGHDLSVSDWGTGLCALHRIRSSA